MARRIHPHGLKLADFADHELFYALDEAADPEGWATAEDIAEQIGIDHENPTHCVGTRLGWMNRYGMMERDDDYTNGDKRRVTRWRLNEKGEALIYPAKLGAAVERALAGMDEGQRAAVVKAIAAELPQSSRQAMHLARRSWTHHVGGWRDRTITPKRK